MAEKKAKKTTAKKPAAEKTKKEKTVARKTTASDETATKKPRSTKAVAAKTSEAPEIKKAAAKKTAVSKVSVTPAQVKKNEALETAEESAIEASKYYPPQASAKDEKKQSAAATAVSEDESKIEDRYYDDKIVLMARDPYWCYAYWDLSEKLMKERSALMKKEWGDYTLALRVYDVTDISFNGSNAHKFNDILVSGDANNWYINVWEAGRSYLVEIGYKAKNGAFVAIARSNAIGTPSDKVSTVTDEEWMVVDEDFEEIFKVSGGGANGTKLGGSESFAPGMSLSSETLSSGSSPYGGPVPGANRGFFLVVDTELILYGQTEKDAVLRVKGEVVQLKKDGSFSLRFHLPNGLMELPVEAVSADGIDKRTVKISVERKTE